MKNKLTNNIGLKILSILAAFVLWLVVVNVDDPVISKTYTGINVELLNTDVLESDNKYYEVIDNSDVITVVVTAKRSVIDEMSKDYIRATADLRVLSARNTVPIEVKSTRYSDRIDSVTTRAEAVKFNVEDIIEKNVPISVDYSGNVSAGFLLSGVSTDIDYVSVKGPRSVVESIAAYKAEVELLDIMKDTEVTQVLQAYDEDNNEVDETNLEVSTSSVDVTFYVDAIKEIPIESAYSGTPAAGYIDTGLVVISPSSVFVSGRGENFSDLKSVNIAPNEVVIDGATGNVVKTIDITDFLPSGVNFYGETGEVDVEVTVEVKPTEHKIIQVPISNIRVDNLPEGYIANVVDIGGTVDVEIQGLGDTFDRFYGDRAEGIIDASKLVPRNIVPGSESVGITTGENDGVVEFTLAPGITVVNPVSMMVIVDYVGVDNPTALGEEASTDASSTQNTEFEQSDSAQSSDEIPAENDNPAALNADSVVVPKIE